MSKAKANSSDPNKVFGELSLDKTCFKVSLSIKDPLRKSMPDSDGADKIVRESNMQDSGAVRVNIALLDKLSVKAYTDPIKELRQYFTENSVPIGSGKQKFRMITRYAHSKFKSEINKRLQAVKDGSIEFLREYGTDAFYAQQQARLGDKYDRDRFPEKESLEKAFKSITDFNVEPFATKEAIQSGGIYMKPEDVASISKSMDAQNKKIREYGNQHLWESLVDAVKEIADVCSKEHGSGKGSIFRNTMIPKIKSLVERMPAMNFDGDKNLQKTIDEVADMLKDVDNDVLREDPVKRKEVADASKKVLDAVASYRPAKKKQAVSA